jgi:hypothetical protein
MLVPLLLLIDGIIWYGVIKAHKFDKSTGPYPENPTFDSDLDKLWSAVAPNVHREWVVCPSGGCETPKDNYNPNMSCQGCKLDRDDKLIKRDFETWIKHEQRRDFTLEDYLWQEGILNPEETIWCEGIPLSAYDAKDMETFEKIKDKALLEGTYNSKNLDEGGLEDLYKTWFMLKGCSDYGADMLVKSGVEPWKFDF